MSYAGISDPDRPGRVLNPFNKNENPTFLPGDKVRDRRDHNGKIWRIIARTAYYDSELMTLRDVDDDLNERTVVAKSLIPYLEMVAMFTIPRPLTPEDEP